MANRTAQPQDSLLGGLLWEYSPSKAYINSLTRIALYLTFIGLIFIGLVVLGFRASSESPNRQSFLGLALGSVLFGVSFLIAAWIVINLVNREKKHRILFYERGIQDIQVNRNRSAQYDELKIWQYSLRTRYGGQHHSYLIRFPDGSTLRTQESEAGNRVQEYVCQYQVPSIINSYEGGSNVDFGPIRINSQGIASSLGFWGQLGLVGGSSGGLLDFIPTSNTVERNSHCKLIPWSDIKQIEVRGGFLYIKKLRGWSVAIAVREIPNFFVLLSLLRYLKYL
jgi:hypothetical protein